MTAVSTAMHQGVQRPTGAAGLWSAVSGRLAAPCTRHAHLDNMYRGHYAIEVQHRHVLTGAAGLSSAVSGRFAATRWKPLSSWLLVTSLLSVSLLFCGWGVGDRDRQQHRMRHLSAQWIM